MHVNSHWTLALALLAPPRMATGQAAALDLSGSRPRAFAEALEAAQVPSW